MTFQMNDRYFHQLGMSPKVERITRGVAQRTQSTIESTAPVDSGDYRAGFSLERRVSKHRIVYRVVGRDPKTLLLESKLGVMARALRRQGRGRG